MNNDEVLPRITTAFDFPADLANHSRQREIIECALRKIVPEGIFIPDSASEDKDLIDDQKNRFHATLPILYSPPCGTFPTNVCFFMLSKFRPNAFRFFYELITHWLVPGKRLNVILLHAVDFSMPELGPDTYTLSEVIIRPDSPADLKEMQQNLPTIGMEIRLGVESSYYARRILEIKGLSSDEKTGLIQEHIAYLVKRLPHQFDYDVWTEMQHVMVMCRDDFKSMRSSRHLSRIISIHYLFRNWLKEAVAAAPEKRHLKLKLFLTKNKGDPDPKTVLGVIVGINFIRDKEIFEERHLLGAIQNYIPKAKSVEHSFFANKRGAEHICTLYLEIEKTENEAFTPEEIAILRKELPTDLKDRIEHLMHPVFMPRNEEEIMRNILSLSNQIKYLRDIPQVFISFDEQTHANLFFTIILVRVMEPGASSIQELFKSSDTFLEYIHDRCKMLGYLRKKYTKEATVFRVKVPKSQFLRRDHSIDLYKARQAVVDGLSMVIGEFRDYNGGMISKQNELLCAVRELLSDNVKYNDLLLENFFYSLTPVIMRTVLEPQALTTLFLMLLEAIDEGFFDGKGYLLKIRTEQQFVFVMIKTEDRTVKDAISRALNKFHLHSSELANSYVKVYDTPYLGYIYRCDDPEKQRHFCQIIEELMPRETVPSRSI